ncbi:NUDIX hydrolase domain-like protein [Scheffersomyces xylosifermentans]|uniref:NUDIX hydrolase domain-like protein n=1 Tax=Scheffersomyces xylosifermentans TaxID=1304137 RepID=UPI00315D2E63
MSSTSSKGSPYDAKLVSVEKLDQGNWIQTRKINYKDPKGADRVWEMAVRTTRSAKTDTDAVSIVTILRHPGKPEEVVLVKQFRPPTSKVVLELPAGLIDPEESIASTAERELLEETGYHGKFTRQSTTVFSDPGLTNANMVLAYVEVDLTDPRNKDPKPQLEDGEFIITFTLPLKNLLRGLEEVMEKEGCTVDARLYHFAVGLSLAQELSLK